MFQPLLHKGKFFTPEKMEEIITTAFDILAEVGITVTNEDAIAGLTRLNYKQKNGRFIIERTEAGKFLEYQRKNKQNLLSHIDKCQSRKGLTGTIESYSGFYEDYKTGQIIKYDTEALVKQTIFVEKCSREYGFMPTVPGCASDVNPILESLHKYKIAAQYCHDGGPIEPTSDVSAKYMFEMADVIGQEMTRLPVYPVSPLNLGGDSFDILLKYKDKLKSTYVFSMSGMGVTSPMSISMSFALCLAEVLGSALFVHELTKLPVDMRPNIFPFDLHALAFAFGSPEKFQYELMAEDFTAQLLDAPLNYHSTNIHTMAVCSGVQATTEKMTLMTAGALYGATHFYCIGTLALDEVFSPNQMLLDLEGMRIVEKMLNKPTLEKIPEDFASYVAKHIDSGFMASDLTLENYKEYLWYPQLYNRKPLQKWLDMGARETAELVKSKINEINSREPGFILDDAKVSKLDELYTRALSEVE